MGLLSEVLFKELTVRTVLALLCCGQVSLYHVGEK